jgi:hypothetical protein
MKATWDDSTPRAHEALAPNPFEAMALLLEDEGQLGAGLIVFNQRCGADLKQIGPRLGRPGRAQPGTEASNSAGDGLRQKGLNQAGKGATGT